MSNYFDESIFTGKFSFKDGVHISNAADEYLCNYYGINYQAKDAMYELNPTHRNSIYNIYTVNKKPYMVDAARINTNPIIVLHDADKIRPLRFEEHDPDFTYIKGTLSALSSAIMIKWYAASSSVKINKILYDFIHELLPECIFTIETPSSLQYDKYGYLNFDDVIIDSKNNVINTNIAGPVYNLF